MESFVLSLPVHPHSSPLLELSRCPSGSQIFWKLFHWAAAEGTWATKGGRKKAHGVKREEAGTEETLLCLWWQEPEQRQSQLAEQRMTAIRLTGNSQAVLNTTTAQTWPSSEDRTEPIKHFEGQNLG